MPFFIFLPSRQQYVSKCVDYIFNTSVKTSYEEFHRGFYTVCNQDIIRQFHPEELMKAIIGNADCDWKQFENVSDNLSFLSSLIYMSSKTFSDFSKLPIHISPKTLFFSCVLKNSLYEEEYHRAHPTILLFWKAFHELTSDEKKKFLCKYCDRYSFLM